MDLKGLALCCRYAYPPNSLSLCGPERQKDMFWYYASQKTDRGTSEILSQFTTLYPYLCLIALENRIKDPFDHRVVEAYWLGNHLLHRVPLSKFYKHLSDGIHLKIRIKRKDWEDIFQKIPIGALPHHAFHVMNIYKRTGNLDIPHTIQTMDACIINWGRIEKITENMLLVKTQDIKQNSNRLFIGPSTIRKISITGIDKLEVEKLKKNDFISYHWGSYCQKLTFSKLRNLVYYTRLAVKLANSGEPV